MDEETKRHLQAPETWRRGLFMLLFYIIFTFVETVLLLIILAQFGFNLVTGKSNSQLTFFGRTLSAYIYHIFRYLSYDTEEKPFPFSLWPISFLTQSSDRS